MSEDGLANMDNFRGTLTDGMDSQQFALFLLKRSLSMPFSSPSIMLLASSEYIAIPTSAKEIMAIKDGSGK